MVLKGLIFGNNPDGAGCAHEHKHTDGNGEPVFLRFHGVMVTPIFDFSSEKKRRQ
jgi:hypothetical protein